jgi:glutamine amidotransferase
MTNLGKNGLDDFARAWIDDGKPFLGVCLGLQLLFENSEESRGVPGLGVFKGRVRAFRPKDFRSKDFRIPHMGWNTLDVVQSQKFGIKKSDSFYFVHTYFPEPEDSSVVLATTRYGRSFCSAAAKANVVATQFHPEKSGDVGLRLLKNVVTRWSRSS